MQKIDLSKFIGERCKVTYRNGKTANCFVRPYIFNEYRVGTRNHELNGMCYPNSNFDIVAIEVIPCKS